MPKTTDLRMLFGTLAVKLIMQKDAAGRSSQQRYVPGHNFLGFFTEKTGNMRCFAV